MTKNRTKRNVPLSSYMPVGQQHLVLFLKIRFISSELANASIPRTGLSLRTGYQMLYSHLLFQEIGDLVPVFSFVCRPFFHLRITLLFYFDFIFLFFRGVSHRLTVLLKIMQWQGKE